MRRPGVWVWIAAGAVALIGAAAVQLVRVGAGLKVEVVPADETAVAQPDFGPLAWVLAGVVVCAVIFAGWAVVRQVIRIRRGR